MRKIASLVLALTLGLTAVPLTVSAAEDAKPISEQVLADVLVFNERVDIKNLSQSGIDPVWGGSGLEKLVDGDTYHSKLGGGVGSSRTVTLTWETESVVPAYLVLYTGDDTTDHPQRNPKSFKFYGVTDTTDVLLTQAGSVMERKNGKPYGFMLDTTQSFSKYKLEFSTNDQIQLDELELYTSKTITPETAKSGVEEGRIDISKYAADFTGGSGCGFLDGNQNFSFPIQYLTGFKDSADALDHTKVYINGVEAKFNKTYLGYTHCGLNAGGGYFYGLVSGKYTANQQNTVLFLIGDQFYCKKTFTTDNSAVALTDSDVTYYKGENRIEAKVTFEDSNHGYVKDEEVVAQIHDEHSDIKFTVAAVDGNTVTFDTSKPTTTTHSLLEFNKAKDSKHPAFSVGIDNLSNTSTMVGYAQTRPNTEDSFDVRILAEGHKDYIAKYKNATIYASFVAPNGKTISFNADTVPNLSKSVKAAGEVVYASDNCGFFGVIIKNIPYGTNSLTVTVKFDDGTEVKVGSVENLAVSDGASVADVKSGKYGAKFDGTITAYTDEDCTKAPDDGNENMTHLFDGKTNKFGTRDTAPVYFKTSKKVTVTGLIFTVANDTNSNGQERTMMSWALYGKNGDGEWEMVAYSNKPITIGTKNYSDSDYASADDMEDSNREAFRVSNAGEFDTYKFEFTRGTDYTQMGELTLYTK